MRRSTCPRESMRRSWLQRLVVRTTGPEWKVAAVLDEALMGVRSPPLGPKERLEASPQEEPVSPRAEHRWMGRPCLGLGLGLGLGARTHSSPSDSGR